MKNFGQYFCISDPITSRVGLLRPTLDAAIVLL